MNQTLLKSLSLIAIASVSGEVASVYFFHQNPVKEVPLHSAVEVLGAFSGVLLTVLYAYLRRFSRDNTAFLCAACGLLAMGVLDFGHAIVPVGNLFVWLRTMATFFGALGFVMVLLPKHWLAKLQPTSLLVGFTLASFSVAVASVFLQDRLPLMSIDLVTTPFTRNLHLFAGGIFLLVTLRLLLSRDEPTNPDRYYLASFCFLQAMAALLFPFADLWTVAWWWWHLLRLLASIFMLYYAFRIVAGLQRSLTEAIRARDDFLDIASHELKTPLTALSLHVQLVGSLLEKGPAGYLPEAKLSEVLKISKKEIRHFSGLIDELLEASRIGARKLTLDLCEVDLSLLIEEVLQQYSIELERKGYVLTKNLNAGVIGRWDRSRVVQVIANLLTNAMKYGGGQPLEMCLQRRNSSAIFTLTDHGIGIAKECQGRIFDRFERAVSEKNYRGLGLGLFISQQIAIAHGGCIRVESVLGKGSTFTLVLPLNSTPA